MQVVILAGGLGTRLSEETKIIPKALVKIGNKPIITHLINYYQSYGYNDFIICLGYKGDLIKSFLTVAILTIYLFYKNSRNNSKMYLCLICLPPDRRLLLTPGMGIGGWGNRDQ